MRTHALVTLVALLSGCHAKPAILEGDLYLRTKGGQVAQGAANTVLLLTDSAPFASHWRAACDSASAAWAMQSDLEDSAQARIYNIEEKLAFLQARIDALKARPIQRQLLLTAVLKETTPYQASTGMKAHFQFREIPAGSYWVFAGMTLLDNPYTWFRRITLAPGDSLRLDLDNKTVLEDPITCDDDLPIVSTDERERALAVRRAHQQRIADSAAALARRRADSAAVSARAHSDSVMRVARAEATAREEAEQKKYWMSPWTGDRFSHRYYSARAYQCQELSEVPPDRRVFFATRREAENAGFHLAPAAECQDTNPAPIVHSPND